MKENSAYEWIVSKIIWYGSAQLVSLKMYKKFDKVFRFIEKIMKNWRLELTSGEKVLTEAKILGRISQGDTLSLLLFVMVIYQRTHELSRL